jgi:hypothetical protein
MPMPTYLLANLSTCPLTCECTTYMHACLGAHRTADPLQVHMRACEQTYVSICIHLTTWSSKRSFPHSIPEYATQWLAVCLFPCGYPKTNSLFTMKMSALLKTKELEFCDIPVRCSSCVPEEQNPHQNFADILQEGLDINIFAPMLQSI